jgi:RNA recognition motif-containing protein
VLFQPPGKQGLCIVNIYVGNLPWSCTEAELQQEFSAFGAVARVQIMIDRDTGRSRGFGFVEMPSDDEARKAIEGMNGKNFGGRPITANEARPKTERTGGGGGGGWGGGGGRGGFGGGRGGGRRGGGDSDASW